MKKIGEGKVRNIYDVGKYLVIDATDRLSAFDNILENNDIINRGKILTGISAFWFDFTKSIIPNHMISINNADMPTEFQSAEFQNRCMLVKKLKMLPVECVVRGYLSGSGWVSYKETGCVCDIKLPRGLKESEKLSSPIFTPTTKATTGHDEHISFKDLCNKIGTSLATTLREKSIEIYSDCSEYALQKGIIIADTKFEYGIDKNGIITLADELLTPDSSRFWIADEYAVGQSQKSLDKQYIRDWLVNSGWDKKPPIPVIPQEVLATTAEKYIKIYEILTGKKFSPQ